MKGDRKRKRSFFQKQHAPFETSCADEGEVPDVVPWSRFGKKDFDNVASNTSDGLAVEVLDSDGKPCDIRLLRPIKEATLSDVTDQDTSEDKRITGCRIIDMRKCEEMWNKCTKEHVQWSSDCVGNLYFDPEREVKVGVAWKEAVYCDMCSYRSGLHKLYTNAETGKPGPKPAALNRALQVGLSETMISNTAMRTILMAADIPAPAHSSMQRAANTVGQTLIQVSKENMHEEQEYLKDLNQKCGLSADEPIRAEGDCRYNNALRSAGGATPFQPATQSVYTVCENNTSRKKIIAVATQNKLCRISNCTHDSDECTANLPMESSIGDEKAWAYECAKELAEAGTVIKYFTTDGDSCQHTGVMEAYEEMNIKVASDNLRDPNHLAASQIKAVKNAKFSAKMFPGKTKESRNQLQSRLARDLSERCKAEVKTCRSEFAGEAAKVTNAMSFARDALIQCLQGKHTLCKKDSFVCGGTKKDKWVFPRLGDAILSPTASDVSQLSGLTDMILGPKSLHLTRFSTTTQKVESVNRAYLRTNPKCVTMARNFESRIHTAIHTLNTGYETSITMKAAAVGAPISVRSRVRRQLKREESLRTRRTKLSRSTRYRRRRATKVKTLYKLHARKKSGEPVTYKKHLLDNPLLQWKKSVKADHDYGQFRVQSCEEHNYSKEG